jgi:hypothetical protein
MTIFRSSALIAALPLAGCGGQPVANQVAAAPGPTPAAGVRAPNDKAQQTRAFKAVFGKAEPVVRQVDREEETTSPVQLIWQGDRAVLITKTEITQGCHYCGGSLGIYYLKPAGDTFTVVGKFPRATLLGSFGQAPEWSVSNTFGPVPTLVARNGAGGQGYACGSIELTELAADRPRKLVKVTAEYVDTGDGLRPNPGSFQLEGQIGKIVPGKSFTMSYTGIKVGTAGLQNFSETYVRTAKGYAVVGKSKLQPCTEDIL